MQFHSLLGIFWISSSEIVDFERFNRQAISLIDTSKMLQSCYIPFEIGTLFRLKPRFYSDFASHFQTGNTITSDNCAYFICAQILPSDNPFCIGRLSDHFGSYQIAELLISIRAVAKFSIGKWINVILE